MIAKTRDSSRRGLSNAAPFETDTLVVVECLSFENRSMGWLTTAMRGNESYTEYTHFARRRNQLSEPREPLEAILQRWAQFFIHQFQLRQLFVVLRRIGRQSERGSAAGG